MCLTPSSNYIHIYYTCFQTTSLRYAHKTCVFKRRRWDTHIKHVFFNDVDEIHYLPTYFRHRRCILSPLGTCDIFMGMKLLLVITYSDFWDRAPTVLLVYPGWVFRGGHSTATNISHLNDVTVIVIPQKRKLLIKFQALKVLSLYSF